MNSVHAIALSSRLNPAQKTIAAQFLQGVGGV
jgi:hypothetical protein